MSFYNTANINQFILIYWEVKYCEEGIIVNYCKFGIFHLFGRGRMGDGCADHALCNKRHRTSGCFKHSRVQWE
jgi:hypothetical protein